MNLPKINRLVLQNLIAGLSDGLILLETEGTIAWANKAALEMHRIQTVSELGADAESYRRNFTLRYRNNHLLDEGQYPLERLLAGETFEDVTVEISPSDNAAECWVHTLRGLILEDDGAKPDVLVLIIRDETPRFEAEARDASATLRARTKIRSGEPYRSAYPKSWGGEVSVTFDDGSTLAAARNQCKGDPEAALDRDEMIAKSRELLSFGGVSDVGGFIDSVLAMADGGPVANPPIG